MDEEDVTGGEGPHQIRHDFDASFAKRNLVAYLDDAQRHGLVGARDAVTGVTAHWMALAFRSSSSCSYASPIS